MEYEKHSIPYYNPIFKNYKRYFPDFYAKIRNNNNKPVEYIIEIKPNIETKIPKHKGNLSRKTKQYREETFLINQSKWKAANQYCKKFGYNFKLLTENNLFQKNK